VTAWWNGCGRSDEFPECHCPKRDLKSPRTGGGDAAGCCPTLGVGEPVASVGCCQLAFASRGEAGCSILVIAGEIDVASAHQFSTALDQLIEGGELRIVVDLSDVQFCGSSGISVLVGTYKRVASAGGWLRIAAPPSHVRRVLELTGLHWLIPIYADLAAALPLD
jgi:anti-sigma B factor antagonist